MPAVASKPEAVQVPRELHTVRASALEEYVRARVRQFSTALTPRVRELAPSVSAESLERAFADTLDSLPSADYGKIPLESMELQLVFRHDCLALGCLDPQCALCQHNSNRRCSVNFDRKYLVNDVLKAKCGAIIRVELVDKGTGMVVEENIPDLRIEMVMLDGNMYDTKFLESGRTLDNSPDSDKELEGCMLLMNNKQQPLLMCGHGGVNEPSGKVVLQLQKGKAVMPEVHVTDSSEALLSGRKPPYRLLVQAVVNGNGPKLNIRYAVSEGFVVATRRTRTAGKADIPSMDDHVSKLEHMGKETVKKLQDIHGAAMQSGIDINIPENCVQKVGDFKALAMRAEQDGHLKQKLQHVLKLCKEKWDEARDHAMKAVVADNRMRAWYADRGNMDIGLLFLTRLGNVDLERPIGLLRKTENGEQKIECTLMAQQTPAQRETVRSLNPQAAHNWWLPGHPGWAIFPMDSEMFLQTGQLLGPAIAQPSSPTTPSAPYSPPPALPSTLKPRAGSISPPGQAPPRANAVGSRSMPPEHLANLLGDYNDSMIARMSGAMPPPRAPQSEPIRMQLPPHAGRGANHLSDYSALAVYNPGNGMYVPAPASPGLSPKSENTSLPHPAQSPRRYLGVANHQEYVAPTLSETLHERTKRKKDTSSAEAETLSAYQSRTYQPAMGSRSPSQLTPPGSPLHGAHLPTPFRPTDNSENYRPPILHPLPPTGHVGHVGHVAYPGTDYTNMPHSNFITSLKPGNGYAPPDFSEPVFIANEASLTNGLATFAPSFDLDKSLELPENWKQYDVPDGSLTLPHGWHVHRANSGLETMQSIEEALPAEYR